MSMGDLAGPDMGISPGVGSSMVMSLSTSSSPPLEPPSSPLASASTAGGGRMSALELLGGSNGGDEAFKSPKYLVNGVVVLESSLKMFLTFVCVHVGHNLIELLNFDSTDEHGRPVHHGTGQSAQLTDTQTSPFADRLTAVCRRALFPPKLPRRLALLHWLCRPSTEDWPTYQSPPLYHHYYLNALFIPTSLPICLRSTTD
jgi:hypothetical protein